MRPYQYGKYVVSTRSAKKQHKVHLRFCLCKYGRQVLESVNSAYYTFRDESSWVNMTDFVTNVCGIKSEIANSLTERGVAGPGGSAWTGAKVRMILRNEIYTGALVVHGDPALRAQGAVPAIVSRQDFDKAEGEVQRQGVWRSAFSKWLGYG